MWIKTKSRMVRYHFGGNIMKDTNKSKSLKYYLEMRIWEKKDVDEIMREVYDKYYELINEAPTISEEM